MLAFLTSEPMCRPQFLCFWAPASGDAVRREETGNGKSKMRPETSNTYISAVHKIEII